MFGPSCLFFCYLKTETRHFVLPLVQQISIERTRNRQQAVSFSSCHPWHAARTLTCVSCLQIPFILHVITLLVSLPLFIKFMCVKSPRRRHHHRQPRHGGKGWYEFVKKKITQWQYAVVGMATLHRFFLSFVSLACWVAASYNSAASSRLAKVVNIWHIFLFRVSRMAFECARRQTTAPQTVFSRLDMFERVFSGLSWIDVEYFFSIESTYEMRSFVN